MWHIIGGEKDGLLVRQGVSLGSEVQGRLAQHSLVQHLDLQGQRLRYRLVSGSGPAEGWISTKLGHKVLALQGSQPECQEGQEGQGQVMPAEFVEILEKGTKHLPAFACEEEDLQMFDAIRQELGQGQRPFSGNWRPAEDGQWKTPWRNGLGSEQVEAADGRKLPYLAKTLQKLSDVVNAEMQQWWANVYEDGSVGCEFHHDGHAEMNITVGASFGAARYLTFQHESGSERSFLQRNGDIFAFDHSVDSNFMHGVYPVKEALGPLGPRISVIIMGRLRSGRGIHSSFLQDQQENRQKFGRNCVQQMERLQKSIDSQVAGLVEEMRDLTCDQEIVEVLEQCRSELLKRKESIERRVRELLEDLDAPNIRGFAKLQMKGIGLMKQQQALLKELKELASKEEKLLLRQRRPLPDG